MEEEISVLASGGQVGTNQSRKKQKKGRKVDHVEPCRKNSMFNKMNDNESMMTLQRMQFFSPTYGIGGKGEAISHAKTIKMTYYIQTLKFMLKKWRGMEDLCTFVFYKYLCA